MRRPGGLLSALTPGRDLPVKEYQEEQNSHTDGQNSQKEDFQGAVFLPLVNSPVQIFVVFGAWFSTTGPARGKFRHALSSSPKITEYGDPVLEMPFPRRLFQFPTNSMKFTWAALREFLFCIPNSAGRDGSPEKESAASSFTKISPVFALKNKLNIDCGTIIIK